MVNSCWTISERHKQKSLQYAHEGYVHNVICWSIVNEDGIEIEGEGHHSTMQVFHDSCEAYSQATCLECGI